MSAVVALLIGLFIGTLVGAVVTAVLTYKFWKEEVEDDGEL